MVSTSEWLTFGNAVPLDVLALAPHPDDAEIGCGGTLLRAKREGCLIGILELTRGEGGSLGSAEERDLEAIEAARILGLSTRGNLRWPDSQIADTHELRLRLAQVIRTLKPNTLLIPHRQDRHPDHVAACAVAKSALHFAAWQRAPLEGEAHKVRRVLEYQGNAPMEATLLVDTSDELETWAQAIMAHHSQFSAGFVSETVNPEILERRRGRLRYWGTFIGSTAAEAFYTDQPLELLPWR